MFKGFKEFISQGNALELAVAVIIGGAFKPIVDAITKVILDIEVFSPDAFVEGEDDQGCGGDRGDGSGIEGDVLEGLEVLDQGVGPLGGSPH